MKTQTRLFSIPILATALVAAHAQSVYLQSDPPVPAVGEEVRIRLMGGAPFQGRELRSEACGNRLLQRLWRSGRTNLDGRVPAFSPVEAGVQLIACSSHGTDDPPSDSMSYGKALVVVGEPPASGKIWRSELGQRLEIVPQTDPVKLVRQGGRFEVQVLLDREPLVGAVIAASAESAPTESYRRAVTDRTGRASFDLDRPGPWLIHLAYKQSRPGYDPGWVLLQSSLFLVAGPAS